MLTYRESITFTCNYGFALKDTFAPPHPQACMRTQLVQCLLHGQTVALLPVLAADHCSPAPCGRYTLPANAISDQKNRKGVHNVVITATCNSGYRSYLPSSLWSNCATARTFPVTCDDCAWKDGGFTCKKVSEKGACHHRSLLRPDNATHPLSRSQVTCEAPTIPNGITNSNISQQFDDPLTITCNEGVSISL